MMKIRHVLGPLPLILLANTAFGQDEAIRKPLSLNWGEPVEKRPGLTLLDEKWFPPFDDKLFLLGKDAGERWAETAMAQARVVGTEDWKSRPYLADRGDGIHTSLLGTYVLPWSRISSAVESASCVCTSSTTTTFAPTVASPPSTSRSVTTCLPSIPGTGGI